MTRVVAILALGFLLGLRHATDSDHVMAVSTIVAREPSARRAAGVGVLWGIGHSATLLAVGGLLVGFRIALPPRLGLGLELMVALMLVALGASNLLGRSRNDEHLHSHKAGLRPFWVGLVHGLAGSAAISLLVLEMIDDSRWAFLYLALFGAGTTAGMAVLTALIALPLAFAAERLTDVRRHVPRLAGIASIAFGVFLAYHIGFVDGLFAK
jgi:high-affinity nickel-transport protein